MGTIIMILLIVAIIAEVGLGTIIFWIICGAAIFFGLLWIIVKLTPTRYYTRNCPWGYHRYGCQPECPLHKHCWGKHPESRNTTHHDHNFWSQQDSGSSSNSNSGHGFLPDTPTSQNEDGDWRTTSMDDIRYDDRERDEENDHDRFDNGGW